MTYVESVTCFFSLQNPAKLMENNLMLLPANSLILWPTPESIIHQRHFKLHFYSTPNPYFIVSYKPFLLQPV